MSKRVPLESTVGWELNEEGFSDSTEKFAPGGILPVFVSNSDALAYLDSTDTQVKAVDRDINSNISKFKPNFISNWNDFLIEWSKYYEQQKSESHYLDTVATMNRTDVYVERLKQFQLEAKNSGATISSTIYTDPNSVVSPENNPQNLIKTAIIGAGVILGGLIVLKAMDYIPKPASELRPKPEEPKQLPRNELETSEEL